LFRWRLISLPINAMLLVACASNSPISDCCADFGIDVNPVLGADAKNCGTIITKSPDAATRSRNESAIACVQRAQLRGRAFVVNQGFSIPPDYYLRNVVVFGAKGEKVLVQIEHQHDGPTTFVGLCKDIKLLSSGKLELAGCEPDETLLARLATHHSRN
jgi:hypothetical protein